MKGLKRNALVIAMALAPALSHAEIKALDDASMGAITGQAGVSIELESQVDIGEFRYTDEGSLAISNISIKGANKTNFFGFNGFSGLTPSTLLDNIKINIDILPDGDLIINLLPITFAAVDFQVTTGQWQLQGPTDSTTLVDNVNIVGAAGAFTLRIDTATDVMTVRSAFAIEDMDLDLPFVAVGLRDVKITGANFDPVAPQPLDLFVDTTMSIFRGTNAAGGDALAINIPVIRMDVTFGSVLVGGTSIGSVKLDDLAITNTAMRIYGH